MSFVVVHESMFGNTRMVAEAIADALRTDGQDVRQLAAADLGSVAFDDDDVLILGAPTHVHTLPSNRTRVAATDMARTSKPPLTLEPTARSSGVREWLDDGATFPAQAAVFDTRMKAPRFLTGSAAVRIARSLRRRRTRLVLPAESFYVSGNRLIDGEIERAGRWARQIAAALTPAGARPGLDTTRGAAPLSR